MSGLSERSSDMWMGLLCCELIMKNGDWFGYYSISLHIEINGAFP